ncbi:MAG TPA: hypothetical protein VF582_04830 [Allosphingosinicella sp.]|jgi:hypothetical protein
MEMLLGLLYTTFVLIAFVLIWFANRAFGSIPRVRRFRAASRTLRKALVNADRVEPKILDVEHLATKRIFEVQQEPQETLEPFKHHELAKVMDLAHLRPIKHDRLIGELKTYCGILTALFIVASADAIEHARFRPDEVLREIGRAPFEFLAALELIMIVVFTIRLAIELLEIGEFGVQRDRAEI